MACVLARRQDRAHRGIIAIDKTASDLLPADRSILSDNRQSSAASAVVGVFVHPEATASAKRSAYGVA